MALFCLYIIGGIALVLFFISRIRIGIRINLGETITADFSIGALYFRIRPITTPLRKRERKKIPERIKKVSKEKTEKIPMPSISDILNGIKTLWSPSKKAFLKLCHGIRIHPFRLSITLPGQPNPAQAAVDYGKYSAFLWAFMPLIEEVFELPDPHIHLEPDFSAEDFNIKGKIKATLRIGTLMAVCIGLGISALHWYIQFRNNVNQRRTLDQNVQKKQQNTQEEKAA